ncbi:MAG TPA: LysR substrate-binding domain-containing protein, partial [Burkholderiaceae bacterium]
MGKIDLNTLLTFAAVAEQGGFTAAAAQLGVAKARVSLDIARLEAQLGASLFARTTRRVSLTDAGQALYADCIPPLRGVQDALAGVAGEGTLAGTLRISGTVAHVTQSLAAVVADFAAVHPALQVDLRTSDRVADIVREGIDVAIRVGWLRDSSLHATQLGDFAQHAVAAPAYLARMGTPRRPEDLASHDWVGLSLLPTPLT